MPTKANRRRLPCAELEKKRRNEIRIFFRITPEILPSVWMKIMRTIIVIVQDHDCIARLTQWKLERRFEGKVTVQVCQNEENTVDFFERSLVGDHGYSLMVLIVGYFFPSVIGPDIVAEVRRAYREHGDRPPLKIFGTSPDLGDEENVQFTRAGADYALWSPFDYDLLAMLLERDMVESSRRLPSSVFG
jgi:hypothetical protein